MNYSIDSTVSVGQQSVSILALLALFLVALGTGVAVATFRSKTPLSPEGGFFLKRMSPLARGAFLILALALVVVGFASLLKPEVGMFLCLMLLALGIASGLLALFFTSKPGVDEPAPGGVSSRGWVSLTLLTLAGVVLVAQEARVLGPLAARTEAAEPSARAPAAPTAQTSNCKVVDLTKGFRPSSRAAVPSRSVVEDEKEQLKRQVQELKRQVQDLERRLSALQAPAARNTGATATSAPTASKGSAVVVDFTNGLRGGSARAAVERSHPSATYRIDDLSKGIRRGR